MRPLFYTALVAAWFAPVAAAADQPSGAPQDPCAGSAALLSVMDRPTFADSPCAAKPGEVVVEAGYSNAIAHGASESALLSYPQIEVRSGLQHGFEWKIIAPTYNRQTDFAAGMPAMVTTGYGDVTLGVRKEFGYTDRWIVTADAAFTLPTGAPMFSSGSADWVANLLAGYTVTPQIGLAGQLGVSSSTVDSALVLTDQFNDRLQAYAEVFGFTSAAGAGGSYAVDGGLQFLLNPNFEIDVEITRSLGTPGGVATRALGLGTGWKI